MQSALATLPEDQRVALVLVDVEGYSVDETARTLGVAPGTVKSRCARARAKLLPLLRHLREGNPEPTGNQGAAPRVKVPTRQDRREGGTAG